MIKLIYIIFKYENMNTTKRILISIIFFLISVCSANAARYTDINNSWTESTNWSDCGTSGSYCTSSSPKTTLCRWDNEYDNGSSGEVKWRVTINNNATPSWTTSCQSWDASAPTWAVSYSTTNWTNQDVTVTITCSDNWGSNCLMYNMANWTISGNSYSKTLSSNEDSSIALKDGAWNISVIDYNVNFIDKIAPTWTVTYSNTNWTNGTVDITIKCEDSWRSNCNMYNIPGWSTTTTSGNYTYYKTVSVNESWIITLKDTAWNQTPINYSVTNIDTTPPTVDYINSKHDTWTKDEVTVSINCSDSDSWCTSKKYRVESSNFNCDSSWDWTNWTSKTFDTNWTYYICFRAKDRAWNWYVYSDVSIVKIDKTPPNVNDIYWTWVSKNDDYIHAYNQEDFSIGVRQNNWSPIIEIRSEFEKTTDKTSFNPHTSSNEKLTSNFDISIVDGVDDRHNNNYRDYTYKITKVCDEADNCTNNIAEFTYHVYASGNNIESTIDSDDLTNPNSVADWTEKKLKITLKDKYWNAVIPVLRSDYTVLREITLDYRYNNDLYLNQYTNEWSSGILLTSLIDDYLIDKSLDYTEQIWTHIKSNKTINIGNTNWKYTAKFKIYAPTYEAWASDGREYVDGNFDINNIEVWLSDITGKKILTLNNNKIDFQFKPLYKLDIAWSLEDSWIIEWIKQDSSLNIKQNKTTSTQTQIYLEFWWEQESLEKLNLKYSTIDNSTNQDFVKNNWTNDDINSITNLGKTSSDINKNIFTNLEISPWAYIDDLEEVYLSSHLSYYILWKRVIINQDIIWKANYHDSTYTSDFSHMSLKISWATYSQEWVKFISSNNSDWDINSISWIINKSSIIKDLKKNIYNNINTTTLNSTTNTTDIKNKTWFEFNTWQAYLFNNNNVVYYKWKDVELWSVDDILIKWQKTIIVEGGNLYITKDMYYNNKSNDILWIVVLKDENGNWWNLYIDPSITNLVWNIFVEKSLIAYDWNNELDWYSSITKFTNQLHIYWSVFSFNTLWGSKKNTVECPYYVTDCSDPKIAQKYDLNYLRRYFIKSWLPNLTWKVIWWWTCRENATNQIICNSDSKYARYITDPWTIDNPTSDSYYIYNIVIEYNPLIKTITPPFFNK